MKLSHGDTFPLLLFAAFYHPEESFRAELKELLSSWVETLEPRYTMLEILKTLKDCKGSVLEPFVLEPIDIEMTGMLIRIAFSKTFAQTRFRIVSRETLGNNGGCVFTNNLKTYYIERFALGKSQVTPKGFWSFVPNNFPENLVQDLGIAMKNTIKLKKYLRASASINDEGYKIEISEANLHLLQWPEKVHLSSMLQKHSCIDGSKETLEDMGLRVDVGNRKVSIIPGSPEATMRLTAHILDENVLVIDPGEKNIGRYKLYLRLVLPTEQSTLLKIVTAVTSDYFKDWLNISVEQAPCVAKPYRLKIAKWLVPHDSWMDTDLLEVV